MKVDYTSLRALYSVNNRENVPENTRSWNDILTNEDGERVVYGAWYMYTEKVKKNPESVEEEIKMVLNRMDSNIKYFSTISTHLKEDDYVNFIVDWVKKKQKENGVSTADEINKYSLQLHQDVNRYRAKHGYAVDIPIQYLKSFTSVYSIYLTNSWMERKDVDKLIDKAIKENKYIQKTQKKESPSLLFRGLVEKVIYEDDKSLSKYNNLKNASLSSVYQTAFMMIKNATGDKYNEKAIKDFAQDILSKDVAEGRKSRNYYDIKFTLQEQKYPESLISFDDAKQYVKDCISSKEFLKESNTEHLIEALWRIGIKISFQEASNLQGFQNDSPYYRRIYNAAQKVYTKEELKNILPKDNAKDYSVKEGCAITNKLGHKMVVVKYNSCKDVEVLVNSEKDFYLVKGVKWEQFSKGRNLLCHGDYKCIKPNKVKAMEVNGTPVMDLLTLNKTNEQKSKEASEPEEELTL